MNLNDFGLGTAALGRPHYINIRKEKAGPFQLENFKALGKQVFEAAYRKGIRYYDTAPGYGLAEALLLDWVKEKNDPNLEVATKWGYVYTANFDPKATVHEIKEHSLEVLTRQWNFSQQLLPYVSTLQIHSATFETGVLQNQSVLNELARLHTEYGMRIGLTTTGHNQLEVLKAALDVHINGKPLFEVFQVTYNVFDQSLLAAKEELHAQNKRIVIKEGVANGRVFPNVNYPNYQQAYQVLEKLATQYNVGMDAIALQFCRQTMEPFKVLSGASRVYQVNENVKAAEICLAEAEIAALKRLAVDPELYWNERKLLPWN